MTTIHSLNSGLTVTAHVCYHMGGEERFRKFIDKGQATGGFAMTGFLATAQLHTQTPPSAQTATRPRSQALPIPPREASAHEPAGTPQGIPGAPVPFCVSRARDVFVSCSGVTWRTLVCVRDFVENLWLAVPLCHCDGFCHSAGGMRNLRVS